jgi:hypothetical protein
LEATPSISFTQEYLSKQEERRWKFDTICEETLILIPMNVCGRYTPGFSIQPCQYKNLNEPLPPFLSWRNLYPNKKGEDGNFDTICEKLRNGFL